MSMYKLIIVDDEEKIRVGLRTIVDWPSLGFELIGEAANGVEALKLIEASAERPDVILTDIRMPVMDGIGLIEQAKERGFELQFVILSGFDYFQYAKRAIELGVFDYVLKPTKIPELTEKFGKLKRKLDEERSNKARQRVSSKLLREKAIKDIVYGHCKGEEELAEAAAEAGLPYRPGAFVYAVATVKPQEAKERNLPFGLEERLLRQFGGALDAFVAADQLGHLVALCVCPLERAGALGQELAEAGRRTIAMLEREDVVANVGLGEPVSSLAQANESYKQSLIALQSVFFRGYRTVLPYRPLPDEPMSAEYPAAYEKKLIAAIDSGSKKEAAAAVDDLFRSALSDERLLPAQVYKICLEMIIILCRQFQSQHEGVSDIFDEKRLLYLNLADFATLHRLKQWFRERIDLMVDLILDGRDRHNSRIVNHIKKLIEKSYHEQITLHDIGDSLFMNPDYLSRLFKKATGQSFIDYLTNYRIDQAKRFLKDVSTKSYEVGFRVGYQNPSYFAKTFKKVTGKSVSEYRDEGRD